MTIRMTYDQKAKMGYLYLFPETFTPAIEETDELEENEFLNVDVDQEGRIVGIEFFNEEANVIRAVHSQAFLYAEHTDRFSLRLQTRFRKVRVTSKELRSTLLKPIIPDSSDLISLT